MLGFSISFYLYRMRQIPVLISRARLWKIRALNILKGENA
jgi:hypothetical protein